MSFSYDTIEISNTIYHNTVVEYHNKVVQYNMKLHTSSQEQM